MSDPATFDFDELRFNGSATAFLFEGKKRAGIDISMFTVHESGVLDQTFLGIEPA